MKKVLQQRLALILRLLAKLLIRKFNPTIIGVTGTVGKTSTKMAMGTVLRTMRRVRVSHDSHNNEFGVPLTIIGDWGRDELRLVSKESPQGGHRLRKAIFWARVVLRACHILLFGSKSRYPEILVLEYGADRPGDIKYLLEIARPHISVVTAVGDMPVHVEFYNGPEAVAREKGRLVEHLGTNDLAVLNSDDDAVAAMEERTRARVMTFGFGEDAEVRVSNFEYREEQKHPVGITFKLEYGGSFVPVRIDGAFGKGVAYAAAAAAAVGISFGMHLVRIADALQFFESPPHRMRMYPGIKGTYIIDDAYNASPLSMRSAFDAIGRFTATRKVGILGDMLELGAYSIAAHEKIGAEAADVFDFLITIGSRGKLIAESARKNGMKAKNIVSFETVESIKEPIENFIKKGDVVLIKASRALALERISHTLKQA
jgi:UDP-N-acetylmuramoyl-tripeptide--D-alanyl-D-alanine ligase